MGLERKAVLRAAPAHTVHYERRRPEETILHGLVREHLETFLAQVQAKTDTGLPEFDKDEFEVFLECGVLAHGFLRVRCADCAHEKRVAFSCKRRGFCPSCGARRMAQSAAVLVDEVIPRVPVRQWVLSFPIPLRIVFAAHPELLTPVLRIVHRVIAGFLFRRAGLKRATADTGTVTLIQRFGSAAAVSKRTSGSFFFVGFRERAKLRTRRSLPAKPCSRISRHSTVAGIQCGAAASMRCLRYGSNGASLPA